jgi:hypothetical protein
LFDVSSNNSLQQDNAWGINFHPVTTTANLTIQSVTFNLQETDPDAVFDFSMNPPVLSDNSGNAVVYNPPPGSTGSQVDVSGLTGSGVTPSITMVGSQTTWTYGQVSFVHDSTSAHLLTINFSAIGGGDTGFAPGDRMRFGAQVTMLDPTANATNDGDGVGVSPVGISTIFAISGVAQTAVTTKFNDTNIRNMAANYPPDLQPVSTNAFYMLPQSPASGNNNDDQSYVELGGGAGGGNAFAVRATLTVPVTSACSNIFGASFGPFMVSADTTAMYDCTTQCPQIIRVDTFLP